MLPGYPYERLAAWRRFFTFATFKDGTLRTVGTAAELPPTCGRLEQWDAHDCQAIARLFDPLLDFAGAAARGKLLLLDTTAGAAAPARVACFQIKARSAEAVFCGNATAGAAAALERHAYRDPLRFTLHVGEQVARVEARVRIDGARTEVAQTWLTEPPTETHALQVQGLRAAACAYLNDYLVVVAPRALAPPGLQGVLVDVDALFAAHPGERPMRRKLALLDPSHAPPRVEFHNLNGRHGAAPMTGLITLGYLASRHPFIAEALGERTIVTPAGPERVPEVTPTPWGLRAHLPVLGVELCALRFEAPALERSAALAPSPLGAAPPAMLRAH